MFSNFSDVSQSKFSGDKIRITLIPTREIKKLLGTVLKIIMRASISPPFVVIVRGAGHVGFMNRIAGILVLPEFVFLFDKRSTRIHNSNTFLIKALTPGHGMKASEKLISTAIEVSALICGHNVTNIVWQRATRLTQ